MVTSYSIVFASFLLLAGRLADVFPAAVVFETGLFVLGALNLVISFVTSNKFGFLVLRGICGVFGAMVLPAAL